MKQLILTLMIISFNLFAGTYSGGSGTSESPYLISNIADLKEMVQTVINSVERTKHFSQTGNIDLSTTQYWDDSDDNSDGDLYNDPNDATSAGDNEGFPGIGNASFKFGGSYDGHDHELQNLTINRSGTGASSGLFSMTNGATIKNINLISMNVSGGGGTGGIVGDATSSTIDNCRTTGSISGTYSVGGCVGHNHSSTMHNCSSSATVSGSGENVGGVVGKNESGTIHECNSTATVTSTNQNVGGLIGQNYQGTITNSYCSGAVTGTSNVGGFVGFNYVTPAKIERCFSTGSVDGSGNYVGGFVGWNNAYSTITDCYARGSVSGAASNSLGGFVGYVQESTLSNCYSTGSVSGSTNSLGFAGAAWRDTQTDCFWDTETSGQSSTVGDATGKTTSEMTDYTTFTDAGWDFVSETVNGTNNYWDADQLGTVNDGYPIMAYQDGADQSLPVTLSNFELKSEYGQVYLSWTTSSELENLGYILERKIEGRGQYEEIASYISDESLEGRGSTTEEQAYSFMDDEVEVGIVYWYRLRDVSFSGKITTHPAQKVTVRDGSDAVFPNSFKLISAYPNPFNSGTTIQYEVRETTDVRLKIYNARGVEVATLVEGTQSRGDYEVWWQGRDDQERDLDSGLYLARFDVGEHSQVLKLTYLK